jgi:mono/diheme cytochrome c family protein
MTVKLLKTVMMASLLMSTSGGPPVDAQGRPAAVIPESIAGRSPVWSLESLQAPAAAPGTSGARLFRTHCATCHGADARGGGPLAERLRDAPPDLTRYTERNDGVFPSARVHRIIDGRDVRSHGDREMPVWGDAFRSEPDGLTPDEAKARIDAIVEHLRAIQRRDAD